MKSAVCCLALCMLTSAASAQDQTGSRVSIFGEDRDRRKTPEFEMPRGVPLESTIDPNRYYVGPSDVFAVNIWLSEPLSFLCTVTPEGTLIIPTVGELRVSDLKLAEAKEKVLSLIRTKYIGGGGSATVTLITPRPLVVTVSGNVLNPGSYVLAAYNRVNQAIEEANRLNAIQTKEDIEAVLETMSTRNIAVRHKDGQTSHVDVQKFLATKADEWNPYLREGDVIVVPRTDFSRYVVGVYGEVNQPGRYEFVQGDSLKDLLAIAYGFTPLAITDSIEFSSLGGDGTAMTSVIVDGRQILDGTAPDRSIKPGDRLVVRSRPDLRSDYIVTVEGEVVYPGTYPVSKNTTLLSEVIRMAGGFTSFASLKTAEVIRQPLRRTEIELERLESLRGGVSEEDSSYYYLETDLRIRKELVSVDFERLFLERDSTEDILLADNDRIVIPSKKQTVYVFGQVVSTGHVPYVQKEGHEYYVSAAGGYTDRARPGDVKIVKAKTKQWLSPDETTIEPGDYVWVPKVVEHSFSYYMAIVAQTAAIISVAVSIVLLVIQTNN